MKKAWEGFKPGVWQEKLMSETLFKKTIHHMKETIVSSKAFQKVHKFYGTDV